MTESVGPDQNQPIVHGQFVCIYVRNYAKKAIAVKVPPKLKPEVLKKSIKKKMKIDFEDQILFLNGQRILDSVSEIQVSNKTIFHLANMKRVNLDNLTFFVRRLKKDSPLFEYKIRSEMKVADFMREKLSENFPDLQNYFLVYTGRQMMPYNTFRQQLVEDGSEIMCVHKIEDRKNQFFQIRKLPLSKLKLGSASQVQDKEAQKIKHKYVKFADEQYFKNQESKLGKGEQFEETTNNSSSNRNKLWKAADKNPDESELKSKCDNPQQILIPNYNNYSVISKNNLGEENQNVHKKLHSNLMAPQLHKKPSNPKNIIEQENQGDNTYDMNLERQRQEENNWNVSFNDIQSDEQIEESQSMRVMHSENRNCSSLSDHNSMLKNSKSEKDEGEIGGSFNLIWNQLNDNKDLIQLSAMIQTENFNLRQLGLNLSRDSIGKKLHFPNSGMKMNHRHCNLIMVGNSFSLGIQNLHNDLIDEFEQAIEANAALNY